MYFFKIIPLLSVFVYAHGSEQCGIPITREVLLRPSHGSQSPETCIKKAKGAPCNIFRHNQSKVIQSLKLPFPTYNAHAHTWRLTSYTYNIPPH